MDLCSASRKFGLICSLLMGVVGVASAQGLVTLYSFCSLPNCTDGAFPDAGVVLDSTGDVYGTTFYGGASGQGTVFKVTAKGAETVLYSFTGQSDGSEPNAGLVRDSKGNLYGTTTSGGNFNPYVCNTGCGTVFEVTALGTEIVVYRFLANGTDGYFPSAGVIRDSNGNLYGTTVYGGASGQGAVFELNSNGAEKLLHNFGGADGASPEASLVRNFKGNLYGTTAHGGASGQGTVFEITAAGLETVLHSFVAGNADGGTPLAGLVRDSSGNFYGTTAAGGKSMPPYCDSGCGTVFKVTAKGVETVLHSFAANGTDGFAPFAGLVRDSSGNLYGTTEEGGAHGYGTVFSVTAGGVETVLHSFVGGADGAFPLGGLVMDKLGNLYGTTSSGGHGYGTVFKLVP
jgi:uncharacterized repeat protein (TIGR03803 family)